MEITSLQKFIHTSPRKLRLVADMVRRQHPEKAMLTLKFTNKAAAKELGDAINTALANAKQGGINLDQIGFKSIEVNEGPKMKRFRAGARGRVKPYKRRMAHIKIILTDEMVVESKIKSQNEKVEETVIASEAKQSSLEVTQTSDNKPTEIASDSKNPRNDEKEKTVKATKKGAK